MAKQQRLTERVIDDLEPAAGRQYVAWDRDLKGFGVRVSPAGTKTFILKYGLASGRDRWKTLGRVGEIALEKARGYAKDDIGIVARGGDPLGTVDAARGALTVAQVGQRFLEDHATQKKPSTARLYKLAIDGHITPRLGALAIGDVTDQDAATLHERLRKTPILANRVIAVLSKMLAWSMKKKYRPAGVNPCLGISKNKEKRRKRYLDEAEYQRLGQALRTSQTIQPAPRLAIELLLLTGARPNEIATLQWAHVDLAGAALHLPDSKTGEKTIHLAPPAVRLLKRWPRLASSPYVFPGTGRRVKGAHMHPSTLAHVWADLRDLAQLPDDVRLYDACRHSFASVAISQHGLSLAQIGEQLGHSQPSTTSRYAHLHADVAKKNATAIGGTIAAALRKRAKR